MICHAVEITNADEMTTSTPMTAFRHRFPARFASLSPTPLP
jgi:hypothetical protein